MTAVGVQPHVSWAGAITALTFRNLKQLTIEDSLYAEKHAVSSGFLASAGDMLGLFSNILHGRAKKVTP